MENNQPGQVVVPHGTPPEPAQNQSGAPEPDRLPETVPASPAPQGPETNAPAAATEEPASWQFTGESTGESSNVAVGADHTFRTVPTNPQDELTWTAAEFVVHEKSPLWYVVLLVIALALSTGLYLLTKDKISTGIALFVAILFGIFAARKPRVQQYVLNAHGIIIGTKHYIFQNFKSFSIIDDGATASVVFMPLKRFMPALTIYVVPDMEQQVIDFLAGLLPFEQHRQDAVDTFLKSIRF